MTPEEYHSHPTHVCIVYNIPTPAVETQNTLKVYFNF